MEFIDKKVRVIWQNLGLMQSRKLCDLTEVLYAETGFRTTEPLPTPEALKPYPACTMLDGNNRHYWFYVKIGAQPKQEGKRLSFSMDFANTGLHVGCDCMPQCIVYLNGKMAQSLDAQHPSLLLDFDTEYEMYIHLYTGSTDRKFAFSACLTLLDTKIRDLYYDLVVPYEAALAIWEDECNRNLILNTLNEALQLLDMRVPFSPAFYESIDRTRDWLYTHFYNGICGRSDAVVSCIGHTHIDVAWLWILEQTAQKAQRSFATVLSLMREYPEYKFMSSQPQLYEYVKEYAPEVYEEIKARVKEGRWETEGAMWVEADNNLTGGESLVRQILFGKRFMKEEFGTENRCVWLPDVFGYSAAMPQIMKKCGIDYFVTSKISWNEFNKMPYDSFMWEGIDGSQIFTYFLTAQSLEDFEWAKREGDEKYKDTLTTYNSMLNPDYVLNTWKRYQQKEYNNEVILSFGYGDGGGGPTADMLEYQRRLAYGIPGIPKTEIRFAGETLSRVYENFLRNTERLHRVPKWVGELYLELHRGTYTSIAKIKKCNRKCELMLQTLEKLSMADACLTGGIYDRETLRKAWKTMLLHQFHDVLPGSSIAAVYERTDRDFAEIFGRGEKMLAEKIRSVSSQVKTDGGIFVYNPGGVVCSDVVDVDGEKVYAADIPACGYKVIQPGAVPHRVILGEKRMENDFFTVLFDDSFTIVSLYDKENDREVVKPGERLNELQVFEDYPKTCDAWEITNYYKEKMWVIDSVVNTEFVDEGARRGIRITREYLRSRLVQTVFLYDDIRRIDFDTYIDWKEEHQLLKAAFPVDVHANEAAYDIQFGNIKRPTHTNTTWDAAKFEVCAHKWADISEDDYGVSVLNDCKYGHSAEGSTLKLTLLKCATSPNPQADKEVHTFRYALYPHAGSFKTAGTARMAQSFNQPMIAQKLDRQDGTLADTFSLIQCANENIMIDTVKEAEDGNGMIVRLYEYFDRKTRAEMTVGVPVKAVYVCDMLENTLKEVPHCDGRITLPVSNFEIVTLRVVFP